jgi:hypothetical protein
MQVESIPKSVAVMTETGKAVTTEATGKQWKGVMLSGAVVMLLGMGSCMSGGSGGDSTHISTGVLMFMGGFAAYVIGRVGGWWHHG